MEMLDEENYHVWLHFLAPYAEKKNNLNFASYFCRQRQSNPGCLRSKRVRYSARNSRSNVLGKQTCVGIFVVVSVDEKFDDRLHGARLKECLKIEM